jgi:hypothetical protein
MAIPIDRSRVDAGAFSNMLYGVGDDRARERDRRRLDDYGRTLRNVASSFIDSTRRIIDVMYSDETRELARDAVSLLSFSSQNDIMQYMDDYRQISMAAPRHRRFLAAHHRYRELVRDGRCNAWGMSRDDFNLPERKEDDIYYRIVHNGEVREDAETERFYSEHEFGLNDQISEASGYRVTIREQLDYLDTHNTMSNLMDLGIDPASPNGELL